MQFLLFLYSVLSILLMLIALPLVARRVPPNWVYGFRVPQTLSDERVWYDANAYAGRLLLVSGAAQLIAVLALYFVPGLNKDSYALSSAAVILISLFATFGLSWRYLQTLAR
jgi:uncharacterized membrane protein